MRNPNSDDPTRHEFQSFTMAVDDRRRTTALCIRCAILVPAGMHWLQPCRPDAVTALSAVPA